MKVKDVMTDQLALAINASQACGRIGVFYNVEERTMAYVFTRAAVFVREKDKVTVCNLGGYQFDMDSPVDWSPNGDLVFTDGNGVRREVRFFSLIPLMHK
jgi:hypothetical protein